MLAKGTRLGPYEIVGMLGAGGMGEVYRARDPRLGREVALKILPESFAEDRDRLRRFEQEVRAVAALNHPNILAVHDTGTQGRIEYVVTELLEGRTLRQKVNEGPMSSRRATECAIQIACGLAAAHEKGIVHRDLKPENVFLLEDGRVKILDFGLAKPAHTVQSGQSTTLDSGMQTTDGVVVGTAGYMAPEQVRGEPVDARTDVFAFGGVLYEMLSGRRAFQRSSSVETMAAVLKEEPADFPVVEEKKISPALERIVRRCLEKHPGQRFQSAKDLRFALENISAVTEEQRALTTPKSPNRWRVAAIVLGGIVVLASAIALREWFRSPEQPNYRELTFRRGNISEARFGPDGQSVIYAAEWNHPPVRLYSVTVNGTNTRPIDLPPSDLLAVSRLGELALVVEGKSSGSQSRLSRAPLAGGAPRELMDDVDAADWSPDGSELAVVRRVGGKSRLEFPIGTVRYETISWLANVRVSPQADAIGFVEHPFPGDDRGSIVMVDLKGNSRHILSGEWAGAQGLAWSADGREIWFTATNTTESHRDLYAVSRAGRQRLVLRAPGGVWLEDIAPDGRVLLARQSRRYEVFASKPGDPSKQIGWVEVMIASSLSHNGQFAVIGDWGSNRDYDVYLVNLDGSPPILLGHGVSGSISTDNKWVTSILPTDTSKILLLPTGPGDTRTVGAPGFQYRSAKWTRDGQQLVVRASQMGHPTRMWLQDLNGSPATHHSGSNRGSLCCSQPFGIRERAELRGKV